MHLSRFWKRRRRTIGWSVFLLAMAGVGIALYVMLPPEPRWVFADGPRRIFYAGDGRFATYRLQEEAATGPVQLWDAATAGELGRFLTGAKAFRGHGHSQDGRYFVALVKGDKADVCRICGVDLQQRREWQVEAAVGRFRSPIFSPGCNFVALLVPSTGDADAEFRVIVETSSGRIVDRFQRLAGAEDDNGHFAAEGGCFVIGCRDEDDEMDYIRAVNTRTGKKTVIDNARFAAVSPDARWLLADRGEDGIWVWDLAGASWHCRLEGAQGTVAANLRHRIDGGINAIYVTNLARARYSLATVKGLRYLGTVRLWSGRTGRVTWGGLASISESPVFSPDSRFVLWNSQGESSQSTLYGLQHKKQVWQRTRIEHLFTPDSRRLVAALSDHVEVLDVATGQTELTIPLPGSAELQPRLTRDGRTLVVAQAPAEEPAPWLWKQVLDWLAPRPDTAPVVIHAFDLETGLLLGRLLTEETEEFWLTEDRQSLLTVYHENNDGRVIETTIRCWDMPPRKPLRWVLGVPLVFGMLLVSLCAAWRKWRRPAPAQAARGVSPCA